MPAFIAVVSENGEKLHFDHPDQVRTCIAKHAASEVVVSIKKRPRRQGDQSMRYYRGVVIPDIAQACGIADPDDYESIHDALAFKFLKLPDSIFGTPRRRSTGKDDLSQEEISKYIDDVIQYAEADIVGCRIRRPEEVDLDDVYDPEWR